MAGLVSAAALAPVVARPGVARRATNGGAPATAQRMPRVNVNASLRSVGASKVRLPYRCPIARCARTAHRTASLGRRHRFLKSPDPRVWETLCGMVRWEGI